MDALYDLLLHYIAGVHAIAIMTTVFIVEHEAAITDVLTNLVGILFGIHLRFHPWRKAPHTWPAARLLKGLHEQRQR